MLTRQNLPFLGGIDGIDFGDNIDFGENIEASVDYGENIDFGDNIDYGDEQTIDFGDGDISSEVKIEEGKVYIEKLSYCTITIVSSEITFAR
jgi:hypothetical protein